MLKKTLARVYEIFKCEPPKRIRIKDLTASFVLHNKLIFLQVK